MGRPSQEGAPGSAELLLHGRFLRRLARSLVADPGQAEDLVQETWTAALENPPRHGGALAGWLASILRRLAITRGLREAERPAREAAAVERRGVAAGSATPGEGPAEIAAELEVQRQVFESVQRLREPYRSTLYLRYYRGLAPLAIARKEGVPVKTVKTRLLRGLELLRSDLDRRHGGVRETWVLALLPLARARPWPGGSEPPGAAAALQPVWLAAGAAVLVTAGAAAWLALREGPAHRAAEVELAGPAAVVAGAAPERRSELATVPDSGRTALEPPARAAEEPGPTSALHGRVQDELGRPLAGVEVVLVALEGKRRAGRGRPGSAEQELACTASDESGAFRIVPVDPGLLRLELSLDGCAPLGRRFLARPRDDLDLGLLVLRAGVHLSGSVVDELGAPVAEAEIWQERLDEGLTFPMRAASRATRPGASRSAASNRTRCSYSRSAPRASPRSSRGRSRHSRQGASSRSCWGPRPGSCSSSVRTRGRARPNGSSCCSRPRGARGTS